MKIPMEERYEFFISTVRSYLNQNNYTYFEEITNSGSHYFRIDTKNSGIKAFLRISDHMLPANKPWCYTLLWTVGKNTPKHKLKNKIFATVKNAIQHSLDYNFKQTLEAL